MREVGNRKDLNFGSFCYFSTLMSEVVKLIIREYGVICFTYVIPGSKVSVQLFSFPIYFETGICVFPGIYTNFLF